jgi:hypothetical protein
VHESPKDIELRGATEVRNEVKPCSSDPHLVKLLNLTIGEGLIDHRNAGITTIATDDRIDHRAVIGAVAAGLDKDCTRESETLLQPLKLLEP